ncbi:MAG: Spy/CpxP family protein refolding chaperone [Burkholderiales bacterium]|jgi:protein CpxP
MKSICTSFIAASLLAGLFGLAMAQTPTEALTPGPRGERMEQMHAKMSARHAKHLAELKGKLNLQASQDGAWNNFAQSMQKPERMARPDRVSMEKMSTPERLERMQAMKAERDAHMQKRINGTKAFYASLSAEQQQIFDKETAQAMGRTGGDMHRMQHGGGHHGRH